MFQTRLVYHLTNGIRTDYGWTYKRVETQEAYDQLKASGWFDTVPELLKSKEPVETLDALPEEDQDNASTIAPDAPGSPDLGVSGVKVGQAGPKKGRPRKKA